MIELNISKTLQFAGGKKPMVIQVQLEEGTTTALYGNSGAGKTTLLKMVAGLVKPDEGFIAVNDVVWFDSAKQINRLPQQRNIGFVFQDYALFPNMTVLQNLQFAMGKQQDQSFIDYLLQLVSLQNFANTKPLNLSGGQQQRLALIRALVRKPQLLLLDEPLSALDAEMRQNLYNAYQTLQKQLGFTALLVSHDVGEVYSLSHRIIQLYQGEITFEGTPQQLFSTSSLSSKLQIPAEIISIIPNGVVYIVELLAGNRIVKITATEDEIRDVNNGDKVMIYTKAFHLGMKKIQQ